MSEKTLYSVLLAWDMNDLGEQGTYSTTVATDDRNLVEALAQEQMFLAHCEDMSFTEEEVAQERAGGEPDYYVIDVVEGANIWAAPELLATLRKVQTFLLAFPPRSYDPENSAAHVTLYAEVNNAVRAGEKVQ